MSTTLIIVLVGVALAVVLGGFMVTIYNRLVTLSQRFMNAFSQIEVQLKRRHDLIPNLVETAKGYMAHERETLEAVIAARNQAVSGLDKASRNPRDAQAMGELTAGEGALTGALGRLFAVMEAYPDLKANQNMLALSEELTSTENRVAFSRQAYNDSVTTYNTYRRSFPPVLFAPLFGHEKDASLLEFEDSEAIKEAPKVSFGS
ncbi:MAG: LemA family protein [Phycisphaerales bacterium]